MRVLSDDPAPKNYGRCLLDATVIPGDRLKFKIVDAWLVTKPIQSNKIKEDISGIIFGYARYTKKALKRRGKIDCYIAERFMPRGGSGTVQHGEAINFMLCSNILAMLGKNVDCKLIPAVSWKTQIKRYYDLGQLYKDIRPCPEHLLDATLIGLYMVYFKAGIKPYSTLSPKDIYRIKARLLDIGGRIKEKEDDKKKSKTKS